MDSKQKVAIILAVIGLFGGGGAFIMIDMSTNYNSTTNEGDTIITNIAESLVKKILCPEQPNLKFCKGGD